MLSEEILATGSCKTYFSLGKSEMCLCFVTVEINEVKLFFFGL